MTETVGIESHLYISLALGLWVKLRVLPRGAASSSATGLRRTRRGYCLSATISYATIDVSDPPWWRWAPNNSSDRIDRKSPHPPQTYKPTHAPNPSVHPPLHDRAADPLPRYEVGHEPVPARAVALQARPEALAGQLHQLSPLQAGAVERLCMDGCVLAG